MITAREKGRKLEITVGGGDEAITILVPPITAKQGSALLASYANVALGVVDGDESGVESENVARISLGEAAFSQLEQLRWAESEIVINAAFFWNVQGGGIEYVNQMLTDGIPKARQTLLEKVGLWDVHSLQQTLLDSALASLTNTAVSNATTTPDGGSKNSEG